MVDSQIFILIYSLFVSFINCGYPPIGDEVQSGSVLLPASRRGRYLANIARRQAVDGTGVHFNKDADRMNADAKKKVDVLSEELLPYIIAEQERRTTLYKRVMSAIQNGEKGVTIAEIRNKPPVIIRKGLLYRCPTNRPPKEPDGSGVIMCEENMEPAPIMYESCLSAEDRELFVADSRYFFCNRHKIEGPDLPRNGSTVIACSPSERTSLNYTSLKCALEDTADVVVHYRYYPDRTYKFVTELDPDREMCDHWSPCQIGYIYSLPSQDTATPANELWQIVPQDSLIEFAIPHENYITSRRKIPIPDGYVYNGTGKYLTEDMEKLKRYCVVPKENINTIEENLEASHTYFSHSVRVTMQFSPFRPEDAGSYYLRFEPVLRSKTKPVQFKKFITINIASSRFRIINQQLMPGQHGNKTIIYYSCNKCTIHGITLRSDDSSIQNLPTSQYRIRKFTDENGNEQSYMEIDLKNVGPRDFGDYFVMVQNDDGSEERIKALTLTAIQVGTIRFSSAPGAHFDETMMYACEECELSDILCHGDSVLPAGRITNIVGAKTINFNFPSFLDLYSCVYMGVFKKNEKTYQKILAIIDNASPRVTMPAPPKLAAPEPGGSFEIALPYVCHVECTVESVHVNGINLMSVSARRSFDVSYAMYMVQGSSVLINIPYFDSMYEGAYQITFYISVDETITKTALELGIIGDGPRHTTTGCPQLEPQTSAPSEGPTEPNIEAPASEAPESAGTPTSETPDLSNVAEAQNRI